MAVIMSQMAKKIAVHNQTFHADDCLSVYLLHNTAEFRDAQVIRTRDPDILATCDAVCDTGGVYDHDKRRYDHHQPGFNETFPGSTIPLSSSGQIYLHWGKEISTNILKRNGRDIGEHVDYVYQSMYEDFMKEVDANDNGISQYGPDVEPLYTIHTGIASRIAMLHADGTLPEEEAFQQAVQLIGTEFEAVLIHMFDSRIPAIAITKRAFESRKSVDPSGKIILLEEGCAFQSHLKALEKQTKCDLVLYAVSARDDGTWAIRCVSGEQEFENRKSLPCASLRDDALSKACGIPGGVFVHKNGFLAAFDTKEHAIEFAKYALKQ